MPNNIKNKKIIFTLPENITLVETIEEILQKNGFQESNEDFDALIDDSESHAMIIKDAALIIYQKKIPESKLAGLLEKHLGTSKETTENIIQNIKQKLVPFAKEISTDEEKTGLSTQEIILDKIRGGTKTRGAPHSSAEKVKGAEIKDVEENAEKLKKAGKRGQDIYKETIE